jgi:hypothetical protein
VFFFICWQSDMVSGQNIREYVADIEMDTTTAALRFHPCELVLFTFFRLPAVIVLGISPACLFRDPTESVHVVPPQQPRRAREMGSRPAYGHGDAEYAPPAVLSLRQARLSLKFYLQLMLPSACDL